MPKYIDRIIPTALFLTAAIVILTHFLFISQGTYFIGDTVNYLEHAYQGKPLTTFLQHVETWPPATAVTFSLLKEFISEPVHMQKAYASLLSVGSLIILWAILAKYTSSKVQAFFISTVILFTATTRLQFMTSLSEPLFVFAWLGSIYTSLQFLDTKRELWLLPLIFFMALLPLTRYIGLVVWGLISLSLLWEWKKAKEKPSPILTILFALTISLFPFIIYLFKNKLVIGTFIPPRDPQMSNITFWQILFDHIVTVFRDLGIVGVILFLWGSITSYKKEWSRPLQIFALSTIGYVIGLSFLLSQTPSAPNFPSRLIAVSYPIIGILFFLLGAYAQHRWQLTKSLPKYTLTLKFATAIWLLFTINQNLQLVHNELSTNTPVFAQAAFSKDLQQLCQPELMKNGYLIIHPHSRNWIAQSMDYNCPELTKISGGELTVDDLDYIFTPYLIATDSVQLIDTYEADKNVKIYQATTKVGLSVDEIIAGRGEYE